MKIKIHHHLFKKILRTLYRVSYASNQSAEFESFFFDAKEDCLVVYAKNERTQIERIIPTSTELEILSPGKMIIGSYILNEIVQRTNETIFLETSEKTVAKLCTTTYEAEINLLDLDQFWSDIKFSVDGVQTIIRVEDLQKLINQVGYAVLTGNGRDIFRGVNLRTKSNELVATATDGSRIARCVLFPFDQDLDIVLRLLTITEVARISESEKTEEIHATFGKERVLFQIGKGIKLLSRILEGPKRFPDTEKQFISSFETVVECQKDELIRAIEKAGVIFKKEDVPSFVFRVEGQRFLVSSLENIEIGSFEQKVNAQIISKNTKKSTLQTKFVLSALKSLPNQEVVISFPPEDGPILFTNKSKKNLKALVLPVWI